MVVSVLPFYRQLAGVVGVPDLVQVAVRVENVSGPFSAMHWE